MTLTQDLKQDLRAFLRRHYSDKRLAALLAHAQDGKLSYMTCCCFIGAVNAPHALRSYEDGMPDPKHVCTARELRGGRVAEQSFFMIGKTDCDRRRIVIPIIRAEMKRRELSRRRERVPSHSPDLVLVP